MAEQSETLLLKVVTEGGEEAAVQIGRVENATDRAAKKTGELSKQTGLLGRGFRGLTSGIGFAIGASGFGALTFGIGDAIKAAQDLQENVASMSQAIKAAKLPVREGTKALTEFADALSVKGGFDVPSELRGLTMFIRVTKSVSQAEKDMTLSTNIARGAHKSLEQATRAVMMVEEGRTSGLTRLGIILPKHISTTKAMAILMQRYSGATAAYNKTSAGSFNDLSHMVDLLAEKAGAVLAPALGAAAQWLIKFITQIQNGTGAGGKFRDIIIGIWNVIKPIGQAIGSVIGGIVSAIGGLSSAGGGGSSTIGKFLQMVKNDALDLWHAFLPVGRAIVSSIQQIGNAAAQIFGGSFGRNVLTIIGVIMSLSRTISKVLFAVVKTALPGIVDVFRGAFNVIAGLVKFIANIITGHFGTALSGLVQMFRGAWGLIKGVILTLTAPVRTMVSGIVGLFSGIGRAIQGAFAGAINWVIDRINDLINGFNSVAGSLPLVGGSLKIGTLGHVSGPAAPAAPVQRPSALKHAVAGHAHALGGPVTGFGHADNVPAYLKPGEYIATENMVGDVGEPAMERWRRGGSPPGGNADDIAAAVAAAIDGMAVYMDGKPVGQVMTRIGLQAKALH